MVEEIIEQWKLRNSQGVRLAGLLYQFSDASDASIASLQQAFLDRGVSPPEASTISKYITTWGEWVIRRERKPEELEKIGIDKLYILRKTPVEEADLWLERAVTMNLREIFSHLGLRQPKMVLRVDANIRAAITETFDYLEKVLRRGLKDPQMNLTQTATMEFLVELVRNIAPLRLVNLWKYFHGEADPIETLDALRTFADEVTVEAK